MTCVKPNVRVGYLSINYIQFGVSKCGALYLLVLFGVQSKESFYARGLQHIQDPLQRDNTSSHLGLSLCHKLSQQHVNAKMRAHLAAQA